MSHDATSPTLTSPLQDQEVSVQGRLASMTHDDFSVLVADLGGRLVRSPRRTTSMVVVGLEGAPSTDGRLSPNLRRARKLRDEGVDIVVLSELDFLEHVELAGRHAAADLQGLYTVAQLHRVLKVPGGRLRAWIRRGLVRPVTRRSNVDFFEFRQIAEFRRIHGWIEGGASLRRIQQSLDALDRWLPPEDTRRSHLDQLSDDGHLRVRLDSGEVVEATGQTRLTLWESEKEADRRSLPDNVAVLPPLSERPSDADARPLAGEWFERGVERERNGRLESALEAYEQSMSLESSAETAFNLGNVLFALGRYRESRSRFQEAVALAPDYTEAWNNLANVHAELEQWEQAAQASRRALSLDPRYIDAHYNLAHAFHALGDHQQAREHGRIYLAADHSSEWSRKLRITLGLV